MAAKLLFNGGLLGLRSLGVRAAVKFYAAAILEAISDERIDSIAFQIYFMLSDR